MGDTSTYCWRTSLRPFAQRLARRACVIHVREFRVRPVPGKRCAGTFSLACWRSSFKFYIKAKHYIAKTQRLFRNIPRHIGIQGYGRGTRKKRTQFMGWKRRTARWRARHRYKTQNDSAQSLAYWIVSSIASNQTAGGVSTPLLILSLVITSC